MKKIWKSYKAGKTGGQHYWTNPQKNYDSLGWFAKQTKYKYRTKIGAGAGGKELKKPISKEEIAEELLKRPPEEIKGVKRINLSKKKEFMGREVGMAKTPGFVPPKRPRDIYLMKEPMEEEIKKHGKYGVDAPYILGHELKHVRDIKKGIEEEEPK